jgi:hypothetical protein
MSKRAVAARLSRRGRKPTLSEAQEKLLIGHVIRHRLELHAVERSTVTGFARAYLRKKLRPQFVSDLLNKYGLSLQRSLPRASRMVDEEVVEGALKIIVELRAEGWDPKAILAMDETGIWSNTIPKKTYHFVNWFEFILFVCSTFDFPLVFLDPSLSTSFVSFPFLPPLCSQFDLL